MKKIMYIFIVALVAAPLTIAIAAPQVASATVQDSRAPEVTGEIWVDVPQNTGMTDQELIDLFNVKSSDGSPITVNTEYVQYDTIGSYSIFFTATNDYGYDMLSAFINITDLGATLTVEKEEATVMQNSKPDYIELFGASATEMTLGDLTDQIVVDDSAVTTQYAGSYPVTFSVTDSDGSLSSETVTLNVQSGKPTITGDYYTTVPAGIEPMTDYEITKFLHVNSSEDDIVVDQSEINYSTPGEYHISFKSTNSYGTTTFQSAFIVK